MTQSFINCSGDTLENVLAKYVGLAGMSLDHVMNDLIDNDVIYSIGCDLNMDEDETINWIYKNADCTCDLLICEDECDLNYDVVKFTVDNDKSFKLDCMQD